MSASHAETPGHAAEVAAESESAIETFANGIGNIIDSVRIFLKNVYSGVKGLFKEIIGGKIESDNGHTKAHEAAPAPAAAHASAATPAPAPAPAHH